MGKAVWIHTSELTLLALYARDELPVTTENLIKSGLSPKDAKKFITRLSRSGFIERVSRGTYKPREVDNSAWESLLHSPMPTIIREYLHEE